VLLKKAVKKFFRTLGYDVKISKHNPEPKRMTEFDESIKLKKIHYACGHRYLEGWLNVDWLKKTDRDVRLVDLVNKHPFPDNFFELGYTEDFLEHIMQGDSLVFLSEVYRTFKPDGTCRLVFPGMDGQVAVGPDFSDFESANEVRNHHYHQFGHVHLYSKDEFEMVCKHIGFSKVEFTRYHESSIDEFKGMETRADVKNYYTYVEITK